MNHFSTSTGERISKAEIDRRVREAKQEKINRMNEEYGYIFCEVCGINGNAGVPLDCSHTISVDECQKSGQAELAWSVDNIKIRCRRCHQIHDHTDLYLKRQTKGNSRRVSRRFLIT